jgi:myo-inositol-1(or 4)-monophosphatase
VSTPADYTLLKEICTTAGAVALQYWGTSKTQRKPDGSLVTDADVACEAVIIEALSRAFPKCAIISEEGTETQGAEGVWFVDPIDGTSSFVEGLAHWGPTLSLVVDGEIVMGAFYQPRLAEFWCVLRDRGAWKNETPVTLTHPKKIRSFHPLYGPSGMHLWEPICWPGKMRALGATAAHLALAATTQGGVALVPRWHFWDIGFGIAMVEHCGGVITDLSGRSWHPLRDPHQPFLAGSPVAITHLLKNGPLLNDD